MMSLVRAQQGEPEKSTCDRKCFFQRCVPQAERDVHFVRDVTQSDTDKSTESIEQTNSVDDQVDEGCDSSIALSAIVPAGVIGTAFVIKKKED